MKLSALSALTVLALCALTLLRLHAAGARLKKPSFSSLKISSKLHEVDSFVAAAGVDHLEASIVSDSLQNFVINSSLGHPFLVVAEGELVSGIEAPAKQELDLMKNLTMKYLDTCNAAGVTMVIDFEGEMPGHGGELVTAAFFETKAVTVDGNPASSKPDEPMKLGFLIDLRCSSGVAILKKVMSSIGITKLIWGANRDLESLMYQRMPVPLEVDPVAIIDVQLGFSLPHQRLGMQRMLQHVPAQFTRGLPDKEQIDFGSFHSRNRRSMPLPLSARNAAYAMDDLHRIQAILMSQTPAGGSYKVAKSLTDETVKQTRADPYGLHALQAELQWLNRKMGTKKIASAVEIKRRILAAPVELRTYDVQRAEHQVDAVLSRAGVSIPEDLSFGQ